MDIEEQSRFRLFAIVVVTMAKAAVVVVVVVVAVVVNPAMTVVHVVFNAVVAILPILVCPV